MSVDFELQLVGGSRAKIGSFGRVVAEVEILIHESDAETPYLGLSRTEGDRVNAEPNGCVLIFGREAEVQNDINASCGKRHADVFRANGRWARPIGKLL